MAFSLAGYKSWECEIDTEGHRTYTLVSRVTTEDPDDGPQQALATPGLPVPGVPWVVGNDVDLDAWCRYNASAKQILPGEKNFWYDVTNTFSSKPIPSDQQRIPGSTPGGGDGGGGGPHQPPTDPLLEPMKISGGFTKFTLEATHDKDGLPIENSAFEPIRGPVVEFDASRPTIRIEQNVALLGLGMIADFIDKVNSEPMWGFPARCIKLSSATWEQKYYNTYSIYYIRVFELEVNAIYDPLTATYSSGWDRTVPDEGTKVLQGRWDKETGDWVLVPVGYNMNQSNPVFGDPTNPQDFMQAIDKNGNYCRIQLNGAGLPANVNVIGTGTSSETGDVGSILIQKYGERDLMLLGLPA